MKALILTEGGKETGFGHITRCIALAQGMEAAGCKVKFVVNADKCGEYLLKKEGVEYSILDWIKNKQTLSSLLQQSAMVLVDSYIAPSRFYRFLSNHESDNLVVAIDDYNRIDYESDVVINPSIFGNELPYKISAKSAKYYLLGKDYIILRREFWEGSKKNIKRDIKQVLITLGGIDNTSFLDKILEYLSAKFPDFKYHIVASEKPNFNPGMKAKWCSNASALTMRNLMFKCDLCISGGGQTLYELIKMGVPTIGICFSTNQSLNLTACKRSHLAEFAGWNTDENIFVSIKKNIEQINYKKRLSISNRGMKSIKKGSATFVAKEILKIGKIK